MSLLAFNKTTSAKNVVATGVTVTVVPLSASGGTRGKPWDVTNALRPNVAADAINGVSGGRTAAEFAAIGVAGSVVMHIIKT